MAAGAASLAILAVALIALGGSPATAQDFLEQRRAADRVSQDPKTLNPFVGVNEEEFMVWAINWELLVGFNPGPHPARRSW